MRGLNLTIIVAAVVLMAILQLFVGRTRLGRAMRSTSQDREAAALMGVDINQTIAITFFIAAALAGAGGVIYGLYFGSVQFNLGFFTGLKAFTAAVLGGIGNTVGAAVGGFTIAFIEVFAANLGYNFLNLAGLEPLRRSRASEASTVRYRSSSPGWSSG